MRLRLLLLARDAARAAACALVLSAGVASTLRSQAAPAAGKIVGRVIDAESGVGLSDAGVQVVGTTIGMMTGVDGRYSIIGVPAGTVTLHVRRIGYAPKTVTGVILGAGATLEQDVSLSSAVARLTEQVVTAAAERGSVSNALDEQRTSTAVVNATTAEQIARSPDANAAQAVQRVSGVTVQDGKYVLVRGLGERYTTTSLNGARVPSPEPEKKLVPLDLFPSALLEGITTSKTFTPDQPGDFSGASVNIKTREFPARRTTSVALSTGMNMRASGSDVLAAPTVGPEWLGLGGARREIPSALVGGLGGLPAGAPTNHVLRSFRNAWSPRTGRGTPNGSFGVTVGGQDPLFGHRVGYVLSTTYAYNQEIRAGETSVIPSPDGQGGAQALSSARGETGRASVLWGGLLNLSTWAGAKSRLSLNNTYTRTADNEARRLSGFDEQWGTEVERTRLSFVERSVLSTQLRGDHVLGARHAVDWTLDRSSVTRAEPDRSDVTYWMENGVFAWKGGANDATRSFSDLDEQASSGAVNYRVSLGSPVRPSEVKVGGSYRDVRRDAMSRSYDIVNQRLDLAARTLSPEELFDGRFAAQADTNFLLATSSFGGEYAAEEQVAAGYAMYDFALTSRLRAIAGARVERAEVAVRSVDAQGSDTTAALSDTDLLPAVSLVLRLSDAQNLRLSASRTLSRPEYRELSPIAYVETGEDVVTRGNPELVRALIENYDVRWEWYPGSAEVLSVGVFAKRFHDPIERLYLATTGASTIGFANAEGANNYGAELDVRKGLGMLGAYGQPFTVFTNLTVMRSRIRIDDSRSAATNPERPMVGQAPYVVNAGLNYASSNGRWSATGLYNVVGRRISMAGVQPLPDTYVRPRHALDLSLHFPIWSTLSGKLNAKNLLDAPVVEKTGDVTRRRYATGSVVSLGLTWSP